jgi:multidrug resistance efflux pump
MILGRQNLLFRNADGGGGGTPPRLAEHQAATTTPPAATVPNAELAALQAQLAALQAERDQYKTKVETAENEKLSEVERLKKERDASLPERKHANQTLRQARAESAVTQEAVKVGADPTLVNRLITVQY